MLYQDPDRDDCQRLINISKLPIGQLFIEREKFRAEFFSDATENDAYAIHVPDPAANLELMESSVRDLLQGWSDRLTTSRAIWVTDVLADLYRRLGIKAIDDQLAAVSYIDQGVWYRVESYGGLSVFIDACIESGDDFWPCVEGAKPLPFKLVHPHRLALRCWRHVTGQAKEDDGGEVDNGGFDEIRVEELFDQAVADYQHFAEFEIEIEPKGLEELAKAIEAYIAANAVEWHQLFEDIAGIPSRSPYPAIKREEYIRSRLPESPSFKLLADALAGVEALYKDDEGLFEKSGQVIGLTKEWWVAQGWNYGEV